jgi:non-specific serine/threonine protein kinase
VALRICAALSRFWYVKGHYREGREWSARALAVAPHAPPAIRAAVLEGAGSLADMQHDAVEASTQLDASVQLWRTVGDNRRLAAALAMQGMLARHGGDPVAARAACDEALTIPVEPPHRFGHRLALSVLGFIAEGEGDRSRARQFLEESLRVARLNASPMEIALQLNNLGVVALRDRRDGEAAGYYREALRLAWEIGAAEIIAGSLEGLAGVAAARHRPRRAAELFGAAAALRQEIGGPPVAQFEEEFHRVVPLVREVLGDDDFQAAAAHGAAIPLAEVVAAAQADIDVADTPPADMPPMFTAVDTTQRATRPTLPVKLTPRQIAYLRLLASGATNRAIAAEMVVSEAAVEQMLVRLYEKLHIRNRSEMIRFAYAHGLFDLDTPAT